MEEDGDGQDDEERGQCGAQGTTDGPRRLAQFVADEGADVDGKHTRTTLGNGNEVEELLLRHPLPFVHHLGLNQWNHGVAATQGEETNAEESGESLPVDAHENDGNDGN